jgi:hypothetical protein
MKASIDNGVRTLAGMPKTSSSLIRTVPNKSAVRNAPKLSIKKSLFGFESSLLSINLNLFVITNSYRCLLYFYKSLLFTASSLTCTGLHLRRPGSQGLSGWCRY